MKKLLAIAVFGLLLLPALSVDGSGPSFSPEIVGPDQPALVCFWTPSAQRASYWQLSLEFRYEIDSQLLAEDLGGILLEKIPMKGLRGDSNARLLNYESLQMAFAHPALDSGDKSGIKVFLYCKGFPPMSEGEAAMRAGQRVILYGNDGSALGGFFQRHSSGYGKLVTVLYYLMGGGNRSRP